MHLISIKHHKIETFGHHNIQMESKTIHVIQQLKEVLLLSLERQTNGSLYGT